MAGQIGGSVTAAGLVAAAPATRWATPQTLSGVVGNAYNPQVTNFPSGPFWRCQTGMSTTSGLAGPGQGSVNPDSGGKGTNASGPEMLQSAALGGNPQGQA
jgi:hypothetical protein